MLGRYTMHRGKRPDVTGVRMDTRKHTKHCLRPAVHMVVKYLSGDAGYSWEQFRRDYLQLVSERFAEDRRPFDVLAERAGTEDVFLGCSCPTKKNPNVNHCHTVVALEFMHEHYPNLDIRFPPGASR